MSTNTKPDRDASDLGIDPLLTVPETAEFFRSSERFVWGHIAKGVIPVVRLGRKVLIRRSDLKRIIRSGI